MSLTLQKRIDAFARLGLLFHQPDHELKEITNLAGQKNGWFNPESVAKAISSLGKMLSKNKLENWLSAYNFPENKPVKTVGLVLAGNIPLVGFHDILCVILSGNRALIKLSAGDDRLIPYVLKKLIDIEPGFKNNIEITERLKDFDAVIATGSNNTSRYFDYYFGKVPNIIRKSRTSVAVITEETTPEQIALLGHDIFDYFGLGCRNVSKIYLPKNFTVDRFFEGVEHFNGIINHHKYNNNYEYQKSIYLVNGHAHFDNGFLLLKEDAALVSPLSVLYYERYENLDEVEKSIDENISHIQCVVSGTKMDIANQVVNFGESQNPGPGDYADGVDTLAFLTALGNSVS